MLGAEELYVFYCGCHMYFLKLALLCICNRYLVLDIADHPLENILKSFQPVSVAIQFIGSKT